MKRSLILAMLITGTIAAAVHARGFGGGFSGGPGGFGINGSGGLWANGINGTGGAWGDGAYGAGLPGFENVPGGNAAYGGFFSGPPSLGMSKGGGAYHPLAGEQGVSEPQVNVNAQRQAFVGSLADMGIQTGGFRPGEFGPPPGTAGLPSDMGMHRASGNNPNGNAQRGRGRLAADAAAPAEGDAARNWSAADLRVLGNSARSNFRDSNLFTRDWFARHSGAWNTRGYVHDLWSATDWSDVTGWFGGDLPNYDYMYGCDLIYENNIVYLYGRPVAAADKYYDSAVSIARSGAQANVSTEARWLPLGVFEAIRSGEKSSAMMFQLAVNKAGVIRGNYFDTAANNLQVVEGAVDKDTQRAAWIVADRKNIIFDCVLYNLTRAETSVLVHMGKDKNEQWMFVRLSQTGSGTPKQ